MNKKGNYSFRQVFTDWRLSRVTAEEDRGEDGGRIEEDRGGRIEGQPERRHLFSLQGRAKIT